jgi:hypothetical protein
MGETISERLLSERRRLLDEWDAVDSATKLLEIQEGIAEQIRDAERAIKDGSHDRDEFVRHIRQLRLYADGLAWQVLHPHVIRQLAKNPSRPPSLINQGEAFDNVLRSARQHLEEDGLPVLVADITNIIKIGDLIIVTHPEFPQIVECKTQRPHPKRWMQGRFGRQISRALGTLRYLSGKPTKVHGEDHVRHVVESQHKAERNWEAVRTCVGAALDHGHGFVELSEHELVCACHYTQLSDALDALGGRANRFPQPLFLGTSRGLFERFDGLLPPPVVWPLAPAGRFAVTEGEIVVIHFVSATALEHEGDGWRIQVTGPDPCHVSVFLEEDEYRFSDRFIADVLYGFETVDSCVSGLLTFARQVRALRTQGDEVLAEVPGASEKPKVTYLGSEKAGLRFAVSQSGDTVTVVPEELWKSMPPPTGEAKVPDSAPDSG